MFGTKNCYISNNCINIKAICNEKPFGSFFGPTEHKHPLKKQVRMHVLVEGTVHVYRLIPNFRFGDINHKKHIDSL